MAALLRLPNALEFTGLKRTTFLTEVKNGNIPAPVRISKKCVAWRQIDLVEWIGSLERATVNH